MLTPTTRHITRPAFIVDPNSIVRSSGGRQIDWDLITERYRAETVKVVVGAAGAIATATTVPVDALPGPLPIGATLDFGTNKFARLTAAAIAGATSLTVAALPTALVDNDEAYYAPIGNSNAVKHIPAGTVMAEIAATGKVVPRAISGAATAVGILETNADQDSQTDALTGYGIIKGGMLYENMLPDATGGPPKVLPSGYKTELQAAGVGMGFGFEQYEDDRG